MAPLGIIGGTNLSHSRILRDCSRDIIETDHGEIGYFKDDLLDLVFIPRHGMDTWCPPHRVNHHGNVAALNSLGVTHVLGITSVGSLKLEIPPGTFLIPEDYIQLTNILTFFHEDTKHVTPSLCPSMLQLIYEVGTTQGFPVRLGGIYLQTTGPRFETPAEIRFFATFADVVGMNMASEATLSNELDMEYANISVVDNYGNGLAGEVSYDAFKESVRGHQDEMDRFLEQLIPRIQKKYK